MWENNDNIHFVKYRQVISQDNVSPKMFQLCCPWLDNTFNHIGNPSLFSPFISKYLPAKYMANYIILYSNYDQYIRGKYRETTAERKTSTIIHQLNNILCNCNCFRLVITKI